MLMIRSVDPNETLGAIGKHLGKGARKDAAWSAIQLAKRSTDVSLLRGIVKVLADALIEIGDRHSERGRPKRSLAAPASDAMIYELPEIHQHPDKDEEKVREIRLRQAVHTYGWVIVARDIVDRRTVSAMNLAGVMWTFDGSIFEGCEAPTVKEMQSKVAKLIKRETESALDIIRPIAAKALKDYGLSNIQRRGFKSFARAAIAKHYGFTIDQMKRAQ